MNIWIFRVFATLPGGKHRRIETFEKCQFLFKFKKGDNFNHRNTLSILRIKIWAWRRNWAKRGVFQRSRRVLYLAVSEPSLIAFFSSLISFFNPFNSSPVTTSAFFIKSFRIFGHVFRGAHIKCSAFYGFWHTGIWLNWDWFYWYPALWWTSMGMAWNCTRYSCWTNRSGYSCRKR